MNRGQSTSLPDFRNFGVMLRILVAVELGAALWVWWSAGFGGTAAVPNSRALLVEPALLTTLALLFAGARALQTLPFRHGAALVITLSCLVTLAWHDVFSRVLLLQPGVDALRAVIAAAVVSGLVLFYFDWRQRVLSPALSEARLAALQSRIRPHFLFNSLNTVLGLIRPDPRRAEAVLENLADLFRALMADTRTLVPLERELALTRSYLEVENLRLGDRLTVRWECDQAPRDASVPQLILQPLAENAVIHGIEPMPAGGEIHIKVFARDQRLRMVVRNTCPADVASNTVKRPSNRMALANIRERLDLHFDAESRMTQSRSGGEFVVEIEFPLRHHPG